MLGNLDIFKQLTVWEGLSLILTLSQLCCIVIVVIDIIHNGHFQ